MGILFINGGEIGGNTAHLGHAFLEGRDFTGEQQFTGMDRRGVLTVAVHSQHGVAAPCRLHLDHRPLREREALCSGNQRRTFERRLAAPALPDPCAIGNVVALRRTFAFMATGEIEDFGEIRCIGARFYPSLEQASTCTS